MNRHLRSRIVDDEWDRVSPRRPCPICGADAGCRVRLSDALVCCASRVSQWPLTNGAWLHRILAERDEIIEIDEIDEIQEISMTGTGP